MPGKWRSFKDKLPKFEVEPEYAARVEEKKKEYIGLDTAEMAREFKVIRAAKKAAEEAISGLNLELEALSQLLVNDLETQSISKLTLQTGETIFISDEPYASLDDKEALMAWVKKKKMQSLLTLNWQTMNSLAKELLSAGKPIMPGVKVWLKTSVRLRNGNSSEE